MNLHLLRLERNDIVPAKNEPIDTAIVSGLSIPVAQEYRVERKAEISSSPNEPRLSEQH
jgi:hypothetical protein